MSEPTVTALILNFRRPANVQQIIEALREQSVPVRIALWHNGADDDIPGADWVIRSDWNAGCLARWHVGALVGSDYVFTIDDDLTPKSAKLIETCIARSMREGDRRILGYTGRILASGPRYYNHGKSVGLSRDEDRYVDIVKGRFMFVPSRLLARVPLAFPGYEGRGDDIWISLHTASGEKTHLLPKEVAGSFSNLEDKEEQVGLSKQPGHTLKRDLVVSNLVSSGYVPWLESGDNERRSALARLKTFLYGRYLWFAYRIRGYRDHR